jgi:hypothetical protein
MHGHRSLLDFAYFSPYPQQLYHTVMVVFGSVHCLLVIEASWCKYRKLHWWG